MATRAAPICSTSWAVMRLREYTSPSRRLTGLPLGKDSSLGCQLSPLGSVMSTAWSMSVSEGLRPLSKAAPYTKGLKVEPGLG